MLANIILQLLLESRSLANVSKHESLLPKGIDFICADLIQRLINGLHKPGSGRSNREKCFHILLHICSIRIIPAFSVLLLPLITLISPISTEEQSLPCTPWTTLSRLWSGCSPVPES